MNANRIQIALSVLVLVLMLMLATAPELTALERVVLVALSPLVLVLHLVEQAHTRRANAKRHQSR